MQSNRPLNRIAGVVVALGVLTYLVTITLYLAVYGNPPGTGEGGAVTTADRINHYLENQAFVHGLWRTEILATLCLAFGGFGLMGRETGRSGLAPAGWLLTGIGGTIMLLMFPFMLGGYPGATQEPTLFQALNESTYLLFHFSNFVVFLGLGLAFLGESSFTGVLPRWLALAGAVLNLYSGAVFLGLVFGIGNLMLAGPTSLVAYMLTAGLGWRIARHG